MKNLFAALIFSISLVSCNSTQTGNNVPPTSGFYVNDSTVTYQIGSNQAIETWQKYLYFHNIGNIDSIIEMDSESIQIYTPDGELISSREEHREQLDAWFTFGDPKFWTIWATSIKNPGEEGDWVITSGVQRTKILDPESGDSTNQNVAIMANILVRGDQIHEFYVHQRELPNN